MEVMVDPACVESGRGQGGSPVRKCFRKRVPKNISEHILRKYFLEILSGNDCWKYFLELFSESIPWEYSLNYFGKCLLKTFSGNTSWNTMKTCSVQVFRVFQEIFPENVFSKHFQKHFQGIFSGNIFWKYFQKVFSAIISRKYFQKVFSENMFWKYSLENVSCNISWPGCLPVPVLTQRKRGPPWLPCPRKVPTFPIHQRQWAASEVHAWTRRYFSENQHKKYRRVGCWRKYCTRRYFSENQHKKYRRVRC